IQGARTHSAFMTAAVNDGCQQHARIAPSDVQGSDSFRPVHLVSGKGSEVHIQIIDVKWNFPGSLDGICMKENATLASDLADGLNVLNHTHFIVCGHDRYQDRLIRD